MDNNRHSYIKSLIQVALWGEYKRTGNEEFKEIYDAWYDKYTDINVRNLD